MDLKEGIFVKENKLFTTIKTTTNHKSLSQYITTLLSN